MSRKVTIQGEEFSVTAAAKALSVSKKHHC